VIADITDATYDSGVFIEEGDVIHHAVTPVVAYHHNSGQNNTGESTIEGCSHATVMFYRNFTGTDTLVVVIDSVAGSATSGVDYQSVPDSVLILPNQTFAQFDIQPFYDGIQEGNEMIKITVLTSLDGSTDTTLQIPVLDYKNISITAISDSVMGNTQNQVQLWVNASFGLPPYLFTWSPESTLDNAFLQNPTATPLQNTWYSIFVEDSVQCSSASDSVLVSLSGCSTLQGSITYLNDLSTPLNNTEVVLSLNTVPVGNDFSDSGGEYYIPGICPAGDYQLHLTSSKPWSGGNAVDALLIVKKFVGLVSFNPLQNKAADVDQSGLANSVDAMLVMRRFVGQITSFVTGDWAFEDGTVSIPSASVLQHDIKGTCYGDINGSYYPAFKQEYSVSLSNNDMLIHADPSDFDIPISVTEDVVPGSFSLVLELPDDGIHISDVVTDAGGTLVYQQDRKALRIAWYRVDPVTLHAGDILFQMHCRYDQTIPLTAAGWLCGPESQVTDGNGIPYGNFRLTMPGILFGGSEFYVGQNAPNPFSGESEIPCYFPEKGRVSLRITDITGRQAGSVIISEQEKGFHYFTVHARDLIPGIYNYTLEFEGKTREQSKTFKMVICK
jgi:hypothetical protein